MLRPVVCAALLFTALSGCSGGPGDSAEEAPSPLAASSTTAASVRQVVRTDSLHFLDPPHMAGQLPEGGAVIRTPVPSEIDYSNGMALPEWSLPRPELGELVVTVRLTVDVQGVVTNPYSYTIPGGRNCFWRVILHFADVQADHVQGSIADSCVPDTPVVATGTRTLEVPLRVADFSALDGDQLSVSVMTTGAYAPSSTVHVLSGTPEADSTLAIERLQLPLDTRTH